MVKGLPLRRFQVFHDFRRDHIRRRQIVGVGQRIILQPNMSRLGNVNVGAGCIADVPARRSQQRINV
jgi:hypothetical protein